MPVEMLHVPSPSPAWNAHATAMPLAAEISTVGALMSSGALYDGSSTLQYKHTHLASVPVPFLAA